MLKARGAPCVYRGNMIEIASKTHRVPPIPIEAIFTMTTFLGLAILEIAVAVVILAPLGSALFKVLLEELFLSRGVIVSAFSAIRALQTTLASFLLPLQAFTFAVGVGLLVPTRGGLVDFVLGRRDHGEAIIVCLGCGAPWNDVGVWF